MDATDNAKMTQEIANMADDELINLYVILRADAKIQRRHRSARNRNGVEYIKVAREMQTRNLTA